MLVKATQTGYYGHLRRKVGSVFELKTVKGKLVTLTPEEQFSPKWMRKLSEKQANAYEAELIAKDEEENGISEDESDESEDAAPVAVAPVSQKVLTPAQKAAATKAAKLAKQDLDSSEV